VDKSDSISKITIAKKTGVVAQVVEHLPGKHKAPSSNPSTTPKKKRISKSKNIINFYNEKGNNY
jgi:signal recognition particle GTPase